MMLYITDRTLQKVTALHRYINDRLVPISILQQSQAVSYQFVATAQGVIFITFCGRKPEAIYNLSSGSARSSQSGSVVYTRVDLKIVSHTVLNIFIYDLRESRRSSHDDYNQ